MCNAPVTLGSGIMIVCDFLAGFGLASYRCRSCQNEIQRGCTALGSYCLGNSTGIGRCQWAAVSWKLIAMLERSNGFEARRSLGIVAVSAGGSKSDRGDRGANLVQQRPRAVQIAPLIDIFPVDPVRLDGDHFLHIVDVFAARCAAVRPPKLRDYHVFGHRKNSLKIDELHRLSSSKSFSIASVVTQAKQFNLEFGSPEYRRRCALYPWPLFRMTTEDQTQTRGQAARRAPSMNSNLDPGRRQGRVSMPRLSVVIGRKGSYDHVRNSGRIQRSDQRRCGLIAGH